MLLLYLYVVGFFWTAPELLRQILQKQPYKHTQAADIYAVGIVIKELVCRNEPYCDSSDLSPKGKFFVNVIISLTKEIAVNIILICLCQ